MHPTPEWLTKIPNLPELNDNIKFFGGHKQTVDYHWEVKWESHLAFEILIILNGVQDTQFSSHHFRVKTEDIMLIPPGVDHKNSCISKGGMTYFCVHFDIDNPTIQQRLISKCPILLDRENPAYDTIRHILYAFIEQLDRLEMTVREMLLNEKLLLELIISLIDYADYVDTLDHEFAASNNSVLILAKSIADMIQYNFDQYTIMPSEEKRYLLSLEYAAQKLNISESTMLKTFKKIYLISPKQYLDQLRFNLSKYLLC